ncbi:MAG TPA: MIP/aquaporin family protein [Tepidisphaeraceae bacterium]|nr:MIP/aquaporin family protein [Tepidisphaeraceae bacterium]
MSAFTAELIGTAILILLGNGVVANVLLKATKGHGSGWIVITFGWGMAVFVGVFCTLGYSGAHLNPAVTIGMAMAGKTPWAQVPAYIVAQMIGAIIGAVFVYFFYRPHFDASDDPTGKLACFCTVPAIRDFATAFFCEMVGTFVLVFPIFLMSDPSFALDLGAKAPQKVNMGLGAIGALPVGLLVFAIGLSLGGTTGYAINPARDLGPRIVHAILPIRQKRDSDWGYAWIPVIAPILGGVLAALAARAIGVLPR